MKLQWIIVPVLIAVSMLACTISIGMPGFEVVRGAGEVIMVERQLSGFNAVEFSGLGNLYIEPGEGQVIRIQGEENIIQHIETEVEDGKLTIGFRDGIRIDPTEPLNFFLTVKELEAIAVSGAGNVEAPDWKSESFSLEISGTGDVDMGELTASEVELEISGSGDLALASLDAEELGVKISGLGGLAIGAGKVEEQAIEISGSGGYDAKSLESEQAKIEISGLGSAKVWVEEHLEVEISGAGSVEYTGDPTIESQISGVGKLTQVEE